MDVIIEILDNSFTPDLLDVIHSTLPLDYYVPLISHTFSEKWVFIGTSTYRASKIHSFNDQPAICWGGYKEWYKNGMLLSRAIKES